MCKYCEKGSNDFTKPLISFSKVVDAKVFIRDDTFWLMCRDIQTGIYERKYIYIKYCPVCGKLLRKMLGVK